MKQALPQTLARFQRWRPGALMRHGSTLLVWMALRAALQTGVVLLLARQLGAQPYGQFVAVIAVASLFVPFVGLGLSNMVLRNGARDPAHEDIYFARAVRWWVRTLLPCAAIAMIAAVVLLPNELPLIATCAATAAELLAASLTDLRARHRQAQQKTNVYGAINAGLPGIRLLALGLLFGVATEVDIAAVLWVYTGSSLCYAIALWIAIPAEAGNPNTPAAEHMTATSGLPFSLAAFAMKLQGEFNKPILAQTGFGLAGGYNVAQRAVDMASLPLLALQEVLWPRLYAQAEPIRQLRRTGLVLLVLALIVGCMLWVAAPLLSYVLGPGYGDAIAALRLLVWLPVLQIGRALLNFHVIHHGRMALIGRACVIGAMVSVLGVLALVPTFGMTGAVAASYAAETTMIIFLLLAVRRFASATPPDAPHVDT